MSLKRIIITGSNGQLGSELRVLSDAYPQYEMIFFSREEFPINDAATAGRIMEKYRPAYFVNAAAYTAVDKAESDMQAAHEINASAVGHLASLCKQYGTKFIHVSTDYVFDGQKPEPLKEDDPVDPINAYGATKLLGERLARQNDPDALIIRTSWVYSSFGKNFVKTMMRLMSEKPAISVVNDQYGSPTYAFDLAEAIMQIIGSEQWTPGIYHFSNEGVISWFDFALAIKELMHASCTVNPIATENYPTPARRPKYSVLDKSKITNTYGIKLKDWKDSLVACFEKMAGNRQWAIGNRQ